MSLGLHSESILSAAALKLTIQQGLPCQAKVTFLSSEAAAVCVRPGIRYSWTTSLPDLSEVKRVGKSATC